MSVMNWQACSLNIFQKKKIEHFVPNFWKEVYIHIEITKKLTKLHYSRNDALRTKTEHIYLLEHFKNRMNLINNRILFLS